MMFMTVLLTTYQMAHKSMLILHSWMTSLKYRPFLWCGRHTSCLFVCLWVLPAILSCTAAGDIIVSNAHQQTWHVSLHRECIIFILIETSGVLKDHSHFMLWLHKHKGHGPLVLLWLLIRVIPCLVVSASVALLMDIQFSVSRGD